MNWYIQNVQRIGFWNLLVRSVLTAAVYGIGMQRNLRFFQGTSTGVDIVSLKIMEYIRDFLSSRRGVTASLINQVLGS